MAKYVLDYTVTPDVVGQIEPSKKSISFKPVVAEEARRKGDTVFQKALCYSSYYTLVYTAFCSFMPAKVAYAAERVISLVQMAN